MAWTREVGSSVLSPADCMCIGVLGSVVLSRQGRPKGLDWARVSFLWDCLLLQVKCYVSFPSQVFSEKANKESLVYFFLLLIYHSGFL